MVEHRRQKTHKNGTGFLKPLVNTYSTFPLHGMTTIPGKISGSLLVAGAITDAVPLIHGPIGCAYQRKLNPFKLHSLFYETPCTDMNDMDLVYGGEEKLKRGIKETFERYHPNLIIVITTCASDLIGDDFKSVVEAAGNDVDCDIVYTTGDFVERARPVGYQDALYAISDQLLCNNTDAEAVERNCNSVNIVTFPIHGSGVRTGEMSSVLEEIGITINKVCFDHTTVSDLHDLVCAELTITDYPMVWTKRMKERLGIDYYELVSLDRYKETGDSDLLCPYGIDGSARIFREIASRFGLEGEAEEVIERHKKDALEELSGILPDLSGKKVACSGMGGLHGIELLLLRDLGMKASVITYRTEGLETILDDDALDEVLNITRGWATQYGSDPEIIVNPTFEEEIRTIKRTGTDIVLSNAGSAHGYNREGLRTFNPLSFMLHHQRVGFECVIELAQLMREALKKPGKRNPLLSMLEYDSHRTGMTPHWATLAEMFGTIRSKAVGDR